jgi:hypothetical protein
VSRLADVLPGIGQGFAGTLLFEGIKYLIERSKDRKLPEKYRRILEKSIKEASDKFRDESEKIKSPQMLNKVEEMLSSPSIDKEKLIGHLRQAGVSENLIEEIYSEIENNFLHAFDEEGIKNQKEFQRVMLYRTTEIRKTQNKAALTEKQLLRMINHVFENIAMSNERLIQIQKNTEEMRSQLAELTGGKSSTGEEPTKIRSSQLDYTVKITKPMGFPKLNANSKKSFNGLQDWLKLPYRRGSQLDEYGKRAQSTSAYFGSELRASEYYIEGEVIPWNSGLHVEILVHTDRWYWQGKFPVDSNGKFQGVIYMHPNYSSAIIKFNVMNENVILTTFDVDMH